jgi:single-stranded-DNA-specific exonuclease
MAKIPFEYYHTIFVPDSEYGLVENISQVFSSKKAYRILMDDMPDLAEHPERDFYLDRDQLTIIYRWLKAGAARNNFFTSTNSLSEKLKADTGYDFNEFQLLLALEAFKELGFINIEAGNQYFRIKCVENPKSRQLSESKILTFHRSWFRGLNG